MGHLLPNFNTLQDCNSLMWYTNVLDETNIQYTINLHMLMNCTLDVNEAYHIRLS